jgi:hypothetical protein
MEKGTQGSDSDMGVAAGSIIWKISYCDNSCGVHFDGGG